MALGPIMLDLQGCELKQEECEILKHPLIGGIVLFSRNYESPEQIKQLITRIHAIRTPHLLVAVDHEGGPVQRFRQGFTALPPASAIGSLYNEDKKQGLNAARLMGWLMASELRCVGVDFSFAPVLDLAYGYSSVIGKRAFHKHPEVVAELAHQYMQGMREAGMPATGKHFPGHGHVKEDSHIARPVDTRDLNDLWLADLLPFERMIHFGLQAVMPAHILFEKVDVMPVGYSKIWLQEILRKQMGFQGVVFSDDLSMEGAGLRNNYTERARLALDAGCDMVLICNHPAAVIDVLKDLNIHKNPTSQARLIVMHAKHAVDVQELHKNPLWQTVVQLAGILNDSPAREMNV